MEAGGRLGVVGCPSLREARCIRQLPASSRYSFVCPLAAVQPREPTHERHSVVVSGSARFMRFASYREGPRIVISERDVGELVAYLEKLGTGLKAACGKA